MIYTEGGTDEVRAQNVHRAVRANSSPDELRDAARELLDLAKTVAGKEAVARVKTTRAALADARATLNSLGVPELASAITSLDTVVADLARVGQNVAGGAALVDAVLDLARNPNPFAGGQGSAIAKALQLAAALAKASNVPALRDAAPLLAKALKLAAKLPSGPVVPVEWALRVAVPLTVDLLSATGARKYTAGGYALAAKSMLDLAAQKETP